MQHIVNESMEKRAGYNLQFLKNSTRKSRVQDDGLCQQRHLFLYSLIYLTVCIYLCNIGTERGQEWGRLLWNMSPEDQASPQAPNSLKAFKRSVFSLHRKYLLPLSTQVSQMISCLVTEFTLTFPKRSLLGSPIHYVHTWGWGLLISLNFTLISQLI